MAVKINQNSFAGEVTKYGGAVLIFSRRALQSCMDDLAETGIFTEHQLSTLANRLNLNGQDRLAAMWEVVFFRIIARIGQFRYEAPLLPSGRTPDFALHAEWQGCRVHLVGDITSVSDAALDKLNPVSRLSDEVVRLAKKHGLDPNKFSVNVEGSLVGEYPGIKMRLWLPKKQDFEKLISTIVQPFIRSLASPGKSEDKLIHNSEGIGFTISYDASQRYHSGGHPSYTTVYSLTRNTIAGKLKEKADQLRSAPNDAIRMIILCDAGCAAMRNSIMPGVAVRADQIATDFLRQTSSVDLVLLVTVTEARDVLNNTSRSIKCDLISAPRGTTSERITDQSKECVRTIFQNALKVMPKPVTNPYSAAANVRDSSFGIGARGGWSNGGGKVRISLRTLQQLLAGELESTEFMRIHDWADPGGLENPFKRRLKEGRLISAVTVVNGGDLDDDWVEFEFGASDPAITEFRATSKK